jgi:hypothetical protein
MNGSGGKTPLILDIGNREKCEINFTPGEESHVPTERRMGGLRCRFGAFGKNKYFLSLPVS